MTSDYDAILFDFDGVLVDSEPIHFSCWLDVLAPYGITLEWDSFETEFVGETDRKLVQVVAARRDPPIDPAVIWADYPKKRDLFRQRMAAALPFSPGIQPLLHSLAPHFPLAVVTSSRRAEVEPVLELGGIRKLFSVGVFGEDVQRHKPDPEPYLKAVAALRAGRPLAVEDSRPGIASARAAGCEVVEIPSTGRVAELVREKLGIDSR